MTTKFKRKGRRRPKFPADDEDEEFGGLSQMVAVSKWVRDSSEAIRLLSVNHKEIEKQLNNIDPARIPVLMDAYLQVHSRALDIVNLLRTRENKRKRLLVVDKEKAS